MTTEMVPPTLEAASMDTFPVELAQRLSQQCHDLGQRASGANTPLTGKN